MRAMWSLLFGKKKNTNEESANIMQAKTKNEELEEESRKEMVRLWIQQVRLPPPPTGEEVVRGMETWGPPTRILPYLYLGSYYNAAHLPTLKEHRITKVLTVAPECGELAHKTNDEEEEEEWELHQHKIFIDDMENTWDVFEECFAVIDNLRTQFQQRKTNKQRKNNEQHNTEDGGAHKDRESEEIDESETDEIEIESQQQEQEEELEIEAEEACLVHCMRGRSRSTSLVVAYLMAREGMSLKEAWWFVKQRRPIIGPHRHLKDQLIQYEKYLRGSNSLDIMSWAQWQIELGKENSTFLPY
ncbi:Dual specificity protein phosphatase [Balamuthia mandrillaris]